MGLTGIREEHNSYGEWLYKGQENDQPTDRPDNKASF